MKRHETLRRILKRIWGVFGWILLTVSSVVLLAVSVIVFQPQIVVDVVTRALRPVFLGSIEITDVEFLALDHVEGVDALVRDPEGRVIAELHDLRADLPLFSVLDQLISGAGTLTIDLKRVHARYARLDLSANSKGELRLADALTPTPSDKTTTSSQEVTVRLRSIVFEQAWIHGAPDPGLPLDVGVQRLTAALLFEGSQLTIGPADLRADARVLGPVRSVGIDFQGKGRLNVEATDEARTSGAPRVPALLEEVHFAATLTQGESRIALSGDQMREKLSVEAKGTYVPEEGILARRSPISLDVIARGTLADLKAEVHVQTEGTKSRLDLTSQWDDELVLDAEWSVDDFSPALLDEGAPATAIDARVAFQARRSPSSRLAAARPDDPEWAHWSGNLKGSFSAFSVAGEQVPPLDLTADFDPPEWSARLETAQGKGRTRLSVQGELDRRLPPLRLNLSGRLDLTELRPYVPGLRRGTGLVEVSGQISPATSQIQARVNLDVQNVQYETAVSARKLRAQGQISGSLSDPQFTAGAQAEDVAVLIGSQKARQFEELEVKWSGSLSSSELSVVAQETGRIIEARSQLSFVPRLEAEQTHVVLRGEGEAVSFSASRIDVNAAGVQIKDVKFSGMGEGELSGTVNRSGVSLKGYARNVPLEEIAERFAIDLSGARGEVDLDADFKLGPGVAEGRIRVILADAGLRRGPGPVKEIPLLDVHLDVIGEGRSLAVVTEITPSRTSDSTSRVDAMVDVVVPEGAFFKQPRSWMDRVTTVETRGSLDLEWIPAALLPDHADIAGRVDFRTQLERPEGGSVPSATLFVRTKGLSVTLPREGKIEGQEVSLTSIEGLDFTANVSHLPERGITRAWVGVFQEERMLGHVRGRVDATLTSLGFPEGLSGYRNAPMEVYAQLARTSLNDLPEGVRVAGARGYLSLSLSGTGSFAQPKLAGRGKLEGFSLDRVPRPKPLDAQVNLNYEEQIANAELSVSASAGQEKERLFAQLEALFSNEISAGAPALERVDASAQLTDFPVDSFVAPETAKGTLSGRVKVSQYGTSQPEFDAVLDLDRLSMGGVRFEGGKLTARADARSAAVVADFEGREFELRADVKTELVWRSPYVPELGTGATGRLVARQFPVSILHPLVSSDLADLDGKLDADLRGRIKDGEPIVSGRVVVKEGSMQLPRLGQQFRDVRAEVEWTESGLVTLKKASFRGVTGRARLEGSARMDGVLPQSARFELKVDRTERLPLSVQGLGVGEFWGDVKGEVDLSWEENRVRTQVDFRSFQVAFPEIVTGGVQSLKPDEHVSVGAWVNEEDFVIVPLQPIEKKKKEGESWAVRIEVDLNNDFWVQQGPRRRIQVGGGLVVAAEEEVTVEGQLSLSRGRILLNGRMFEIDEGTVTFQPDDPGNPIIVAEARWQSPEGTVVIARFLGPVQSGEMTLTSEPPLPQDQIVSLLLFGDTSGLNGGTDSGGGNNDAQAVAVGGSVATQGLNQALSRVDAVDISTRIDTTGEDVVRPEVVIQLTNSVSAQVGYNLEEPSPGESPDRTVVSLEVRLSGGNAVSATLGDRGSAYFDWVWRYRY